MRAIVQSEYGQPAEALEYRDDVNPPAAPAAGKVLVRVHAASLNPADWHMTTGLPYLVRPTAGLRRPKRGIAGADIAGTVEAVGEGVTRFRSGDELFGEVDGGSFAELAAVAEAEVAVRPANLSFEEAAAIPLAGLTALQGLRDHGEVSAGQRVLVNGASGGVGTFAVQIARWLGAEVTGVCSTRNLEMVRSLGADRVIDYTTEDFADDDARYDVVFDAVGNRTGADVRRILTPEGRLVLVSGPKDNRVLGPVTKLVGTILSFVFTSQQARTFVAKVTVDDLERLAELAESGDLRPVITRRIGLDEVPSALQELGDGHTSGKIVVAI